MNTDRDIMLRSREEPQAFAEIFERHARVVGAFIARRLGNDAAQDVLSEAFLVAFRRRASFNVEYESARPWLFGIAVRLIAQHRRVEATQWQAIAAAESTRAPNADDDVLRSERRMDAETQARGLAPRIAALSDDDRDTLLLYAWGDLTYEQVADALEVPVGTVRSRLKRVRRTLREEDSDARV